MREENEERPDLKIKMTLDDIIQAQQELEKVVREVKLEQAHHGARVAAALAGIGAVGFHYLYPSLSSLSPLSIVALGISAAAYSYLLVSPISQGLNLLDRKKLRRPKVYEMVNDDSLMIFNTGGYAPLLYDRFLLQKAPPGHLEKYLTDQAEAHQKFCEIEKNRNPEKYDFLRIMVEAESDRGKQFELLSQEQINLTKLWINLYTAPGCWLRGTTAKRQAYDNIQFFRIQAAESHLLSLLLGYGAKFFQQGYQRPDLTAAHKEKLSQCISTAEEGAALYQNLGEFHNRCREASERHYQFFYPPEQKLHRWLPL